jgi:hypothetical protein
VGVDVALQIAPRHRIDVVRLAENGEAKRCALERTLHVRLNALSNKLANNASLQT